MAESGKSRRVKAAPAKAAPVKTARVKSVQKPTAATPASTIVVGIGASAGGLEALELLLSGVPSNSGLAYVVVQHLDPTLPTMSSELLQRCTEMPVAEIVDGDLVRPDQVYILPPNREVSILKGVLHLFEPAGKRGLRLPIDCFLRSLAEDAAERSIGVILSGMGSDGTLGLTAIKGRSGVAFVQDPTEAKFASMPNSAIEAGLADVVAPAGKLASRIIAYLAHAPLIDRKGVTESEENRVAVDKVIILLREHSGNDFSLYKRSAVQRRIERRMGIHQLVRTQDYVRYLQEHPEETGDLFKDMLIGVTSFFRDTAVWEQLAKETFPAMLADRGPRQAIRMWVTGCSSGEEAYSLAITFREVLDRLEPERHQAIQIFATDLDAAAIARARDGSYAAGIAADVGPDRLERFFVPTKRGFEVSKSIRESVIFAPHNLISDPPFTRLDLVSCRNLLIYLSSTLQARLIPLFHYSLRPGGLLLLGNSETVNALPHLFEAVPGRARLYRRLETDARPSFSDFGHAIRSPLAGPRPVARPLAGSRIQHDVEQLLLDRHTPVAVLTDRDGEILFVNGATSRFLEVSKGPSKWNVLTMSREGLRAELSDAFRRALREKASVVRPGVRVGSGDAASTVDLTVRALREPESLAGTVLILFAPRDDQPAPVNVKGLRRSRSSSRTKGLEAELQRSERALQSSRDEMHSFHEDANAATEELQSGNEELQSTNEELMTSKEETQSMNEELQTLNQELQGRVDELSRLTNDMKNLLDSTDLATLFLDRELCIRLFSAGSSRIFRLRPEDTGRPIADFASYLVYPELEAHANKVLKDLVVSEQTATSMDGRWFMVRIMPYRTLANVVDGVAVTFTDITEAKTLEAKLMATQVRLERDLSTQGEELARVNAERRTPEQP